MAKTSRAKIEEPPEPVNLQNGAEAGAGQITTGPAEGAPQAPDILAEKPKRRKRDRAQVEQAEPVNQSPVAVARLEELASEKADTSALVLLSIMDGLASVLFGDNARMNPTERELISKPLGRVIERYIPNVDKSLDRWADPVLIVMGLIAWGSRINRLRAEKIITEGPEPEPETATPQKRGTAAMVDGDNHRAKIEDGIPPVIFNNIGMPE